MYFTLAVSAATPQRCTALAGAAQGTDPRIMPIPGPAQVTWRSPDQRAAVLCWPGGATPLTPGPWASHAGTIWAEPACGDPATLCARTGLTRVDPVYLAQTPDAVVVSDRACWAAAVTGRLGDHDPVMVGAFLSLGYPVGAATPFRGVRALGGGRRLQFLRGYVLDHGDASPMFGIVRRRAAERSLSSPQADAHAVWALATLAALLSGDWLNARG